MPESDTESLDFNQLRNRYYAMRHGHSLANEAGLIVSHPDNGVSGYGLSRLGREQAASAARNIRQVVAVEPRSLIIISSDFMRARETAGIVYTACQCDTAVTLASRLRERCFGDYELGVDSLYPTVWAEDLDAPVKPAMGVESLWSVSERVTGLITDLERQYNDRHILLIAHGDILQITQCVFTGRDISGHRDVDHLQTAEIRLLNLSPVRDS